MLALGLLSIIQAVFLPGYLVLRLMGLARGKGAGEGAGGGRGAGALRTLVLALAISLVFNHILVLALVGIGAFTRIAVLAVIALELALLAGLVAGGRARPAEPGEVVETDRDRLTALMKELRRRPPLQSLLAHGAVLGGLISIVVYGGWAIGNAGTVFSEWDAVVSWNRWALDWHANRLPAVTWYYPQLLPTTSALTYVLIGTSEVQFFAKAIMGLFPLAVLLAFADLALRLRDPRYALGLVLAAYGMFALLRGGMMSGMADAPVAAMGFIAVYALLLGSHERRWEQARALALAGAVAAAGCALTKQAGWHFAALYPALAYILVGRGCAWRAGGRPHRLGVAALGIVLAMAGPWYLYRLLNPSGSEFPYVMQLIHGERTYLDRAQRGLELMAAALGASRWFVLWVLPAALLASLADRAWRWITPALCLPMIAMYLLFFTYDLRNVALAIPMCAGGIAIGGSVLANGLLGAMTRLPGRVSGGGYAILARNLLVLGIGAGFIVLGATRLSPRMLRKEQARLQARVFDAEMNRILLAHARERGFDGKIISNYQVLPYLPEIGPLYIFDALTDERRVERLIRHHGARYVLYYGLAPPEFLIAGAGSGRLAPLSQGPLHRLFEVAGAAPR